MGSTKLRDVFRRQAEQRSKGYCEWCGDTGTDVHHIFNRNLFADGGYHTGNSAHLCGLCHYKTERNEIPAWSLYIRVHGEGLCGESTDDLLEYVRHNLGWSEEEIFDTWGNCWGPQGNLRGQLYQEEGCQRALKDSLWKFSMYYKYPKTYHLPWSPHNERDDRKLTNTNHFNGRTVVVTEKMDGENTTIYRDHIHARSLDSADHPSRSWVKNLHGQIRHLIPEGMRICGENLYAKHSIAYDNLDSFFMVFSIWIDERCLSWDDTLEYCELLDLPTVPVLAEATWTPFVAKAWEDEVEGWDASYPGVEGYVVRLRDSFDMKDFPLSIAKYVRPNHVQTDQHWMSQEVVPNVLKVPSDI